MHKKGNPLHSTIPYNSNVWTNKCIGWLPTVTSSVYVKVEILVQVGMKRMGKFIKSVNPNSNLNNDRRFLYGFFY